MSDYFKTVEFLPLLSAQEEKELGLAWKHNQDEAALNKLIESNIRFVLRKARAFSRKFNSNWEELASAGSMGLVEAARRYDPEAYDCRFLTYANWWVERYIIKYFQTDKIISLPTKVQALVRKYNSLEDKSLDSAKENLELSQEEVQNLQELSNLNMCSSLDRPIGEDGDLTLIDLLVDEENIPTYSDEKTYLRKLVKNLPEREQFILNRSFGLDGQDPWTYVEIGAAIQPPISRERVRQLLERALKRLSLQIRGHL